MEGITRHLGAACAPAMDILVARRLGEGYVDAVFIKKRYSARRGGTNEKDIV